MRFIIRADASSIIGTGHIFRTLSLAKKLKSLKHKIIYLSRSLPHTVKHRIISSGFKIIPIPPMKPFESEKKFVLTVLEKVKPHWIIVDHYLVKDTYFLSFKKNPLMRIMAIDDINHTKFPVDLLLNQNIGASKYKYQCDKHTIKLLGPNYALVNEIYSNKRKKANIRSKLQRVLITMGGADQSNQTLKVLKGIELSGRSVAVDIIVGVVYRFDRELKQLLSNLALKNRIHKDIPHLADLMLKADLAIGAGGSTCWEMCTLFLPMILIPIADNQVNIAKGLAKAGAAIYPGSSADITENTIAQIIRSITNEKITEMSRKAGAICDGEGINRVITYL